MAKTFSLKKRNKQVNKRRKKGKEEKEDLPVTSKKRKKETRTLKVTDLNK
jgi:hypothetical protein